MLYLVVGLLRERRFREGLMTGAIMLAVLARLARDSQAHARARLGTWWNAPPGPGDRAPATGQPAPHQAA